MRKVKKQKGKIIGIIPARMDSTRFPGKPLAKICGIPMIGHVYLRSKMCKQLDDVYVATCDKEIFDYIDSIGGKAVMTADTHVRCTDRTAEAMLKIEKQNKYEIDMVVMIQGDEPMILPEMIKKSVKPMLNDCDIEITNLMASINSIEEHRDPNTVKVVVGKDNFALYFSREPIPSGKKFKGIPTAYKQVCIIPCRKDFLIKFSKLSQTPLEIIESVDMLRILEHGYKVKMVLSEFDTASVDTIDDLHKVEELMKCDILLKKYALK